MKSKVLTFILGTAVGAAIAAGVFSTRSVKPGAPETEIASSAAPADTAELESELAALKAKLKLSEQANDLLTAQVQALNQKAATPTPAPEESKKPSGLAAMFGGDGTNGISEAMSEMMKNAMAQQFDAKLSGMKSKLNLTPEQEAAIREIMETQVTRGLEMAQKMLKGDMSQEEIKEAGKSMDEEAQIKALLTPEQTTAYDEFEKEEKNRMARLSANSELMQLQSQLRLSEEQQDKVFGVLVAQAQATFGSDPNPGWDLQKNADKKAEALRSILTPEQFERYEKFQAQQQKLIEALMPKNSGNAVMHDTHIIVR